MLIRLLLFFYFILFTNFALTKEIPVIVISASKTPQSKGTVGSDVTVINAKEIEKYSNSFLMDVLDYNTSGINLFQMGGTGTNSGIQLRGLPKRYSTVYIDGVKQSDPSSTDNSFYSQDIMKDSIGGVEILKGSQSTLYGSNAIGGTVNIFTKKGREGHHSNYNATVGGRNTKNAYYSLDGAENKYDYYLGFNTYQTDGISAMNDNSEKDAYSNESLSSNFGYQIFDDLKLENSLRLKQSNLDYDSVNKTLTDKNSNTDDMSINYVFKIIKDDNEKFKKTLVYNKSYSERKTTGHNPATGNTMTTGYADFYGYRDAINFLGEYNIDLDSKIVFGFDNEFDGAKYPKESNSVKKYVDEAIYSQYFDWQFRPIKNLYATFGGRIDTHSTTGREISERATLAYKLDNNSKIRASYGTGIRFPSLYDFHMGSSNITIKEDLNAERSQSIDVGYETFLPERNLILDVSIFHIKQRDALVSQNQTGWMMKNSALSNESQGLELNTK